MPRIDLNRISDEATIWVFGISPALDADGSAALLRHVDAFLDQWTAHNVPVASGRELRDGSFLIIAAEKNSETSGCSIDRMFGLVRQIESAFGVSILDANRVFFRDASGRMASSTRADFREQATPDTVVFDTTAQTLGAIRSGAWERRAQDSWHNALLRRSA